MKTEITNTIESRELELYIENEKAWIERIEAMAVKRLKAGTFDLTLGIKGAMHTANLAAKDYKLHFGSMTDKWSDMFTKKDRELACESILLGIVAEYKLGNY